MKVNYFDLGLFDGKEIDMMMDIFAKLNIDDYNVYGFEAHPIYAIKIANRFSNNKKIKIIGAAIGSEDGKTMLYMNPNLEGHSIYSTKNNVTDKKIEVLSMALSSWIKQSVSDFKTSFNILRANIEGAEWPLLKDLEANGLFSYFHVYCGTWDDIKKVKELSGNIDEFNEIISKNNIHIHRFTSYQPNNNADIMSIIKTKMEELNGR